MGQSRPSHYRGRGIVNQYLVCDARNLGQALSAKTIVDVTITSPPYWNLKDYATRRQIGYGQSYEECLNDLATVFAAVYEKTRDTGSLWIVADTLKTGGELKPFPFDIASRLKRLGWILQDIIIWNKDKSLPWSHRGKLRNIFEYILFFSKTKKFKYYIDRVRGLDDLKDWWRRYPERYSPNGKAPARTWHIPIPRQGSWGENWVRHFCPLPPDLVRRLLLLTTDPGDLVADPFAGSGVVLAQAAAMSRKYFGVDLSSKYRKMFQTKVLPSIKDLERVHNQRDPLQRSQKRFQETIWTLRRLKFPRELQRLYDTPERKLHARAILASSSSRSRLQLVLMTSRNGRSGPDLKCLKSLISKPPLSKYGLTVDVALTQKVPARSRSKAKFYLYENGNTHLFRKSGPLHDLLHQLRREDMPGRFAPIISNLRVDRTFLRHRGNGQRRRP